LAARRTTTDFNVTIDSRCRKWHGLLLPGDVHLACGWKGRDADIEELHRLHHEFGRAILDLTFEDDDWPAMRPLRTAASAGHQEVNLRRTAWGV
jgi:hypothetical protein